MKNRYQVSEAFKDSCKANVGLNRHGRIHIVEDNIDIVGENYDGQLVDFTIEDNCYVNNTFIGTTVAKKITINILNPNNKLNLDNKEISVYTGVEFNEQIEEIPFGNYIIEKPNNEEVKERVAFTGYDYMIKFNKPYEDRMAYPIELGTFFQDLCSQVGLVAGNIKFTNSNYMILGNPFTNGENCRTVLSNIAQLAGGFARIGRDNKVYIITLNKNSAIETIDGNNYYEDFSKNEQWGEVNSVILSLSSIEGEKTEKKDEDSILKNGLTSITIEDNYFLINEEERNKVIDNLWNNLKGIKYLPFKTKYYGYPYLDTGDKINIFDSKDNKFISYVFNHTFTFNGGFEGELTADALTETQIAYKSNSNINKRIRKAERSIDKINGKIEDVVEEVDNQTQKISDVTQTVDELRSHISEIADITTSTDGNGSVYLANINESEPVRLEIRPRGEDIAYLHPRNNLFPSNTLFMPNRKVRFATKSYSIEWEIPADLLYYDAENYDELILDYEGQSCVVNKKVGYNADGTKYLLSKPKTLTFKYPSIPLQAGDYTITVLGYPSAYLFVRLMCQNIYTDQFATKAEMHSTVTQTAESITAEVTKKLTNYSTTVQMNSVIEQKANSILSTVSETYATKTSLDNYSTTTQMNSAITQKADSILSTVSTTYATKTSLGNYSTTEEMNSAIEQKADSITSTVSKTFATKAELSTAKTEIKQTTDSITSTVSKKVGASEIISKINQSAEEVQINASKINLSAYATKKSVTASLELKVNTEDLISEINASADTINLKAGRLVITSGNFLLNKEGVVTSVEGKFKINSSNGIKRMDFSNSGLRYYNFSGKEIGGLVSIKYEDTSSIGDLLLTLSEGTSLSISKTSSDGKYFTEWMKFENINDVPYIRNTCSGTLFNDAGGIKVKNGLITDWNIETATGTLYFSDPGSGKLVAISVKNGLITDWNVE